MRSKFSTLAMAAAFWLVLASGTAHANNDVQNGFEREIGHILARTFVGAVSHAIVHTPHRGSHHARHHYARPRRPAPPRTLVVVKPLPRRHVHHAPQRPHFRPPAHHHHRHRHGCGHRGYRGHGGVWFIWGN